MNVKIKTGAVAAAKPKFLLWQYIFFFLKNFSYAKRNLTIPQILITATSV